jgi:chitin disaccharide deacetylase
VTSRLLIVNADDFGLTDGVSRAVVHAHRAGVVTSTSILAVARSFDFAARQVRDAPALGLGAHLALVGEDPPLLSPREVPTLVDRTGAFPLSWRTVVRRLALRRVDPADVRREFSAQLDRIAGIGVPITHVDTHQHLHLWPSVGRIVVELAAERGIPAVRRPRSARRIGVGTGVRVLSRLLSRRIAVAGLQTTDDYAGLDEAGGVDTATFGRTLDALARRGGRSAEFNLHPGEADDPVVARFGWNYRWADELDALLSPITRERIDRAGYRLGTFADLATLATRC